MTSSLHAIQDLANRAYRILHIRIRQRVDFCNKHVKQGVQKRRNGGVNVLTQNGKLGKAEGGFVIRLARARLSQGVRRRDIFFQGRNTFFYLDIPKYYQVVVSV